MRFTPKTTDELIEVANSDEPMKDFILTVHMRAHSAEDIEDWFCRTVMGESAIAEIETWSVEEE